MLKYIFLGTIQGLTEFFPVSSSAHLVIFQKILGINEQQLALDVVLHLGTFLALLVFFYKDIFKALGDFKYVGLIIIVTFITGVIGITGKDFFESLFFNVKIVALSLTATGIILILTKKFFVSKRETLNVGDAVIMGFVQGLAIVPGLSRSGLTISSLLFRKIDRQICFRFSFLASMPAILGATLLEAKDITEGVKNGYLNFAAGFVVSFITGLFALSVLKRSLRSAKFHYFGYYCIILAIVAFIFIK